MAYAIAPTQLDTYAAGIDDIAYAQTGDGYFGRMSLLAMGLTEAEADAVLMSSLATEPGISITMENYMAWLLQAGESSGSTTGTLGTDGSGEASEQSDDVEETELTDEDMMLSDGTDSYDGTDPYDGTDTYDGTETSDGTELNDDESDMDTELTDLTTASGEQSVDNVGTNSTMSGFGPDSPVTWRDSNMKPSDGAFDTEFTSDNITVRDDGSMLMELLPNPGGEYNFTGAEISSAEPVLYGRYEMSIRASDQEGVLSTMFTYTGESEGNEHDEIDIEIMGKDPTTAQVGMFRDGQHELTMIDLGFDSSAGFNDYAFEWAPDSITWYVNDVMVHQFNASDGYDIPSTPQRLFANLWANDDSVQGWGGYKDKETATSMEIAGYSYTPL
ncbi:family 16 glycosylhydrolase [Pseudosulfitobacter koreensis]|uniref:Beta-glucanase n=1 Tax=Pseudosulfitobacter koreensis TaxID=2968472 RepID=A0ABT1YY77_9RHOB|nr:family 16 glycosylhydrolase [Pseudosulfitobacter koreense]MCR8825842.1 family 16 glycosylhydrolase [Pseudosulfitobacter koreense]